MIIETHKGTVRIQTRSSDRRTPKIRYATNMPRVRFESYENPFLMLDEYCGNPECNCREVGLEFLEINETGTEPENRLQFYFYLNLDTWKENRKVNNSGISQSLIDEFIRSLTDEHKRKFREDYKSVKKKVSKAAKFQMPLNEIRKGALVSYAEVFSDSGSIMYGGNSYGFDFEYENEKYYIDDMYCIDPACICETAHLVFLKTDEKTDITSDIFTARLNFNKGTEIEVHPSMKKVDAMKIFTEWQNSDKEALDILKNRYAELKEIGKNLAKKQGGYEKPPDNSILLFNNRKIGRNEPCPCGSGKKYKKCCGGRT